MSEEYNKIKAMWVVNNQKETARNYLRADIQSCEVSILSCDNNVRDLISELNNLIQGMQSGIDIELISLCQQTSSKIQNAVRFLQNSRTHLDQIDTREWINDDGIY